MPQRRPNPTKSPIICGKVISVTRNCYHFHVELWNTAGKVVFLRLKSSTFKDGMWYVHGWKVVIL